MLFIGLDKFIY